MNMDQASALNRCKELYQTEQYDILKKLFDEYDLTNFTPVNEEDEKFKKMVIKNNYEEQLYEYIDEARWSEIEKEFKDHFEQIETTTITYALHVATRKY